jgi:cytoskeletal protein CcmA (bactofilin family)
MFGMKKTPPIRTLIGEGTVFQGDIRFTDGLRIDGEVIGNVTAQGDQRSMLVVSENAKITGRIRAGHVIINGAINGPVESDHLLELQPKARIVGDVSYQALEMHQGATIDGEMHPMNASDKPTALKLASNNG